MQSKKIKTSKRVNSVKKNSIPLSTPMSGIFDFGGMNGVTPSSQPFEMANSASFNLLSLQRVLLSYSYVQFGPLRTLVDQPVYDSFRGGIEIKSDEVSPEDIEHLHRELKKMKVFKTITNAMRWDRLYGGAGIIVNVDQDFKTELKIDTITEDTMLSFRSADRWELAWQGVPNTEQAKFNFYGETVHASRVAKIIGEEPPALVAQRLQGWGMSAIECVVREINSYFKEQNVIFELLDEAKIDIWKIKGFNAQILSKAANGTTAKRIQIANYMKNFLGAVALDKEDDFETKSLTFSGLSEMLEQIRIGIAAAVRMPMSKIFGLAASGFASGEDDIENYNAIVENERDKVRDVLDVIIPICCKKFWGFVPDDLDYTFKPLRVLTAEQEQSVKDSEFNRLTSLYHDGILSDQKYCQALKEANIFTMETEVSKGLVEAEPRFGGNMDWGVEDQGTPSDIPSTGKDEKSPKERKVNPIPRGDRSTAKARI